MRFESDIVGGPPASRTVYVVDDDSELRRSLQYLLDALGVAVCPYSCGEHFLSEVDYLAPSPIILDVNMPRTDGTQVLQEMARRLIKWPVVILSGTEDVENTVEALGLDAIAFLEKPTRSADLVKALDKAFEHLAH